jgi:anti-sigma factor RsiW
VSDPTCQELVELVTDYLDGALPSPEHERVERHLDACAGCTTYLEQVRETIRLAGALPEDDRARTLRGRLLEQFRSRKHSPA